MPVHRRLRGKCPSTILAAMRLTFTARLRGFQDRLARSLPRQMAPQFARLGEHLITFRARPVHGRNCVSAVGNVYLRIHFKVQNVYPRIPFSYHGCVLRGGWLCGDLVAYIPCCRFTLALRFWNILCGSDTRIHLFSHLGGGGVRGGSKCGWPEKTKKIRRLAATVAPRDINTTLVCKRFTSSLH
jgi:hypothetical protein